MSWAFPTYRRDIKELQGADFQFSESILNLNVIYIDKEEAHTILFRFSINGRKCIASFNAASRRSICRWGESTFYYINMQAERSKDFMLPIESKPLLKVSQKIKITIFKLLEIVSSKIVHFSFPLWKEDRKYSWKTGQWLD